ncbi:MAG: 23S rRNA (guanosine(2251)-2'-O)-methyltransferase RlmB [Clostridia bacterium]|nr:23S rRNA (guanosine(2251)-2'-O)-methyltransferase RlmB [Clostridia bacterium]
MAFNTKRTADKDNGRRPQKNNADRQRTYGHDRKQNTSDNAHTEARRYQQFEYRSHELQQNNDRNEQNNDYILTGRNPIREALKNHHDLEKLLVQKGELSGSAREIVQKAKEQKIQIQVVEKSRLDAITPNHQGLIAFASAYQYSSVEEILETAYEKGEDPFLILLDGITDPHNLGAIIRTAECTGVHGIIIPQHRSVGLTPSAVKSSAGAVEYVKVARVSNLSRTIEYLQEKNIWLYAVTMNGEDYRQTSFTGGVALVIGAEEDGISRLVAQKCDYTVSLPMKGKIESLNASVAAGIMMYRVLECRK